MNFKNFVIKFYHAQKFVTYLTGLPTKITIRTPIKILFNPRQPPMFDSDLSVRVLSDNPNCYWKRKARTCVGCWAAHWMAFIAVTRTHIDIEDGSVSLSRVTTRFTRRSSIHCHSAMYTASLTLSSSRVSTALILASTTQLALKEVTCFISRFSLVLLYDGHW